ncbi:hypothetical protein EJ03DRAFT_351213 [Teratosphaeria nubilosa]|uniref:Interferon-induced 6-16 n=1 Tax=Teratosphaeria nubilosa TaxID=161662 RepID=A0A6G1LB75_9PEZI|nr:hypothetical protein EJ03DRAFT_351213 [Teratosphaeria nubilosa]
MGQAISVVQKAVHSIKKSIADIVTKPVSKNLENVQNYCRRNARQLAIQAGAMTVAILPAIVAGPALAAMGFGAAGPVAGMLAPAWQSVFGTGALFSTLQSAAMGGYGVAAANAVVTSGALGAAAAAEVAKKPKKDDEEAGE